MFLAVDSSTLCRGVSLLMGAARPTAAYQWYRGEPGWDAWRFGQMDWGVMVAGGCGGKGSGSGSVGVVGGARLLQHAEAEARRLATNNQLTMACPCRW
eukprot:3629442-Amphidinium_carterae.1